MEACNRIFSFSVTQMPVNFQASTNTITACVSRKSCATARFTVQLPPPTLYFVQRTRSPGWLSLQIKKTPKIFLGEIT